MIGIPLIGLYDSFLSFRPSIAEKLNHCNELEHSRSDDDAVDRWMWMIGHIYNTLEKLSIHSISSLYIFLWFSFK